MLQGSHQTCPPGKAGTAGLGGGALGSLSPWKQTARSCFSQKQGPVKNHMNDAIASQLNPTLLAMYLLDPALVTGIVTVSEACFLVSNCVYGLGKIPSEHQTK